MQRTEWVNRKFSLIPDNGLLPFIIERLAGTPARIDEMISVVNPGTLKISPRGKWSVQEHIGHLSDLEPLWLARTEELSAGAELLTAADMTNKKTHEAGHNNTDIKILSATFREQREKLVAKLRSLTDEELTHCSLHPRLQIMMRVVDLAYFVAEHDDHHLAAMQCLIQA